MTYTELARKASLCAASLAEYGIAPGDRVCVRCQRSADALAGVLGIMISGAIYVPVSPTYPPERITYIMEDSSCSVLLDDGSIAATYSNRIPVLSLRYAINGLGVGQPSATYSLEALKDEPQRIAYILYTSGSTGRPKGVTVSHSAAMNTFAWMANAFSLSSADTIPQKTAWGFTDSLWEMFLPLCLGGCVYFISDDAVRNPIALYKELRSCGAAITQFVPPAISAFLDTVCREIASPSLPCLRWVLNGGEELPRALVDRWFSIFPHIGYANSYGMTESAIYATCYFMKQSPVWGMRRIPIGKPISNAKITILGDNGEILAPDQVGEICVGGKSLMTCYWGQPELTSKAIIPHPHTSELMYKTGDYGSLRYDGEISYVGRRDHQVKIRGMRVELGEIERVIEQHQSVKQAAVVMKGEGDTKTLVAFYTVYSEDPGESSIVTHLTGMLPSHMVPSRCIKLDKMPLTAHNKIDRARLRDTVIPARSTQQPDRPTPGSIEETISQTWAQVLCTEDFGLDDAFFAAGGNSLLLVRVYANLPDHLQRILTITDLLHYPTIRKLAVRVREMVTESHTVTEGKTELPSCGRNPSALSRLRQNGSIRGNVEHHG